MTERSAQLYNDRLYKKALERAAAHSHTGASAKDVAKDLADGAAEENVEIAKRLLARNMDIRAIEYLTDLSEDAIRSLSK
jgi:hypothetical protein